MKEGNRESTGSEHYKQKKRTGGVPWPLVKHFSAQYHWGIEQFRICIMGLAWFDGPEPAVRWL